jgi:hypothetical protein
LTTPSISAPLHFRGRLCLLLGLGLGVLGVVAFIVQTALGRLAVPWYMPALALLGAGLVLISLAEKRTIWRIAALPSLMFLAGAEWAIFYAMRLPPYTGPITVGRPFPAFETSRADGTPLAQSDLAGEQKTVLVFFRGRW